MLVCHVEASAARAGSNDADTAPGAGGVDGSGADQDLPSYYLLVQRPDAIRITHVLVYCDERAPPSRRGAAGRRRVDWCVVVVVVYVVFMLLQAALQNLLVRRALGLHLRRR
ncbi:hypothetical protein FOA52_006075 [Chlamydomonas sp. UWO 241]|nr:hypothetical protein FOA52_006075 [Chlamydomonas sp. UWO 241]